MFTARFDGRRRPPRRSDVLRQLPAERIALGGRPFARAPCGGDLLRRGAAPAADAERGSPKRLNPGRRPVDRSVELRDHEEPLQVTARSSPPASIHRRNPRAIRDAGQEVEAAGTSGLGQYRPRADGDWTEVALLPAGLKIRHARRGLPAAIRRGARGGAQRRLPHLQLVGDWHSHTHPGSELPSLQDAKAWCGQMDALARDAYVSVLVSPSKQMGWTLPQFSGWIAGRYGSPSRPVVGRARIAC